MRKIKRMLLRTNLTRLIELFVNERFILSSALARNEDRFLYQFQNLVSLQFLCISNLNKYLDSKEGRHINLRTPCGCKSV